MKKLQAGIIRNLNPDDIYTYKNNVFLSLDIDWAHDEIIKDVIDLIGDVSSTWFVTHDTPVLSELRKNKNFELGIHPNFNILLGGSNDQKLTATTLIDNLINIVPEAKTARSHSVTQSGVLLKILSDRGITHDSNDCIPFESNIALKPFRTIYEIIKCPYLWADEHEWVFDRETNFEAVFNQSELLIFDFHPIHVFLNTENEYRYERTRHLHQNPEELIKHRFEGEGTRTRLLQLLEQVGNNA